MRDKFQYAGSRSTTSFARAALTAKSFPGECDVSTRLTRRIKLNIPLALVADGYGHRSDMAISLGSRRGPGRHSQEHVDRRPRPRKSTRSSTAHNGIIFDPVTLQPDATVGKAEMMAEHNVSGLPITEPSGRLAGILTRRDLRFLEASDMHIAEVMTREHLVTATGNVTLEEAEKILMANKVEKLLLVDENNRLTGLITIKDIDKMPRFPNACKDRQGRLRVGAAIGVHEYQRAESLLSKDVDVLVVDGARAFDQRGRNSAQAWARRWDIDVIAGNVATKEGCQDLIAAGADAVKVGIGPGSICTTRVISGVGVPQITAVYQAAQAAAAGIPIVADGGIRYSGDLTKAIAAGAHSVMIGGLFAGLAESPGELILYQGRTFKIYRGMGSMGASQRLQRAISTRRRNAAARNLCPRGRRTCPLQRQLERVCLPTDRRIACRDGVLRCTWH